MTFFKKMTFAALAATTLFGTAAFADSDSITVTVPFAFVVNGHTLPAGSYEIQANDVNSILSIRNGKTGFLVASNPGTSGASNRPSLVFEQHGGTRYLVSVHMDSYTDRTLPAPVSAPLGALTRR